MSVVFLRRSGALVGLSVAVGALGGSCWAAVPHQKQIINWVWASCYAGGDTHFEVSSNTVTTVVAVTLDVSVTPVACQHAGGRSVVVYHGLTVVNDGTTEDGFALQCEPVTDLGWPVAIYADDGAGGGIGGDGIHQQGENNLITTTGPLAPGARCPILVAVAVAPQATADQRQLTRIHAISETNPDARAAAEVTTVAIAPSSHLEITPQMEPLTTTETGAHYFAHAVIHCGAAADIITLTAASDSGWPVGLLLDDNGDGVRQRWECTPVTRPLAVGAGEALPVFAVVQIPAETVPTTEAEITITAISGVDGSRAETTDSIRLEPRVPMPEEILIQALFPAGWHMMSLPMEPVNHDPAAVIGSFDPMSGLYRYLPERLTYSSYDSQGWPGFGQMDTGVGYWMRVPYDTIIAYRGVAHCESFEIPLRSVGWAMIGHPFPNPTPTASLRVRDAEGATVSLADAAAAAWIELPLAYWNAENIGYAYAGLGRSDYEDRYLRPWHGYWLGVHRPGITLIVPAPGS